MSFSWLGVCLASVYLRLFLEFPQSWFRQFLHVVFDVYVGKWEVEAICFTILLELHNFRYGNWWLLSQSNFKFSGLPWWKFISGLPNSPLCMFVISISGGVVAVVVFGWGVRVGVCLRAPSVSRRPLQQSWFQACAFPNVLLLRLPWRTLGGSWKEGCIRGFYEIALGDGALDFYSRMLG